MEGQDKDQLEKQLEQKIGEAYALLQNGSTLSQLPERFYTALEGISSVFLAWKKGNGAPGWSRILVNLKGQPIFTEEQ